MCGHCLAHAGVFDILQLIFQAYFPYDLADSGVMNMRYFGEKVMFDLEIQSAYQPAHQFIAGGKIGCCFDLVGREFIGQFV